MIHALESLRSALHVPFFLYDQGEIGISVANELEKLERCSVNQQPHFYTAGYWFLKRAAEHPWRVRNASLARILVVPGLIDFNLLPPCRALNVTSWPRVASAVSRHPLWRQRFHDHILVSTASHGMSGLSKYRLANRSQLPSDRQWPSLTRFFLETMFFAPHHPRYAPREGRQRNISDYLLPVPYVDGGSAYLTDDRDNRHDAAKRSIDFFFGGQTTTRIGPGRRHLGYYSRWHLFRQWSASPTSFPKTLLVEVDNGGKPLEFATRKDRPRPAVPRCDTAREAARIQDGVTTPPPRAAKPNASCVPQCTDAALRASSGGACWGSYDAALLAWRARFVLCIRGDIPSSPRLYETVRAGSIPVFVSDHIWRVGLPFQCFVPYELMTLSISERDIQQDAALALRNLSHGISPTMERRMRHLIRHYRRDLLWRAPDSRVMENILLEADRWRVSRMHPAGCCPITDLTQGLEAEAANKMAQYG